MVCAAESAILKLVQINWSRYLFENGKKKVKISLEQAVKAQSGSTGIDLFFL